MLTFLAPAALAGTLLLAVPVVVHLFKPRKMRPTPFSSLRFLRATQHRLSRRVQWHQLLLFLLRAGFVLALVFALARPWVGGGAAARPVDRYVVLDVSRSMGYRVPDRPTPLERGKAVAAELLAAARTGDRTAVLFTGSSTRLVTPPTPDPRPFLPAVHAAEPTATDTRLGSALRVIRPFALHPREGADVEVVFVTDNPRAGLQQVDVAAFLAGLPTQPRVRVIDVGLAGGQNGWVSGARLVNLSEGRKGLRVELGAAGDAAKDRTVRVAGLGPDEASRAVQLDPGRPVAVTFPVPADADLRGKTAHVRLDPPDALPGDDEFFVNLDAAGALRVLLVEAPGGEGAERSAHHLRVAVEALAEDGSRPVALTTRPAADATDADVRAADVVLLAAVPELAEPTVAALKDRVRGGVGLAVFLGDGVRPPFYNAKLHDPLNPAAGLLPLALKAPETPPEPVPLSEVRWAHHLLAGQGDPVLGDLARARFRAFYRFDGTPPAGDTVLARVGGEAAIIDHPVGAGRVLLFNTTANDDWGGLPRGASFVPLVDRVLTYLSAGGVRHSFEAGEPVSLPLPEYTPGEAFRVRTPAGGTLTPTVAAVGGQWLLRLPEVAEPGVYVVEAGAKSFPFVVNAGREDALPAAADPATLAAWWAPAAFEVTPADEAARELAAGAGGVALWPWLMALAVPLLLLETYLVHRLCPRVTEAGATMIVRRAAPEAARAP